LIWPCRWARLGWARRVPSGELRASGRFQLTPPEARAAPWVPCPNPRV
jgi:hypothetical protein